MILRRAFLAGVAGLALCAPLGTRAQGVPVIDVTRLNNMINRVTQSQTEYANETTKLGSETQLSGIAQQQRDAYATFLANATGTTDIAGLEAGAGGAPSAAVTFPSDESTRGDAQRLFGDGASVEQMIIKAAADHTNDPGVGKAGLNPTTWRVLLQSLVKQESAFNNAARSPVGAMGFTQLMPATAADLGVNPADPQGNLEGGAKYLAQQLNSFGRVDYALAAYNAGPGAVQKYGGIPPYTETQAYVLRIQGFYTAYLAKITGQDQTGTLAGVDSARADWGNVADAQASYATYQSGQVQMAMQRIASLLSRPQPTSVKQSVDFNTYMLAERDRLMALSLRMAAAEARADGAKGMYQAARQLTASTFWEYSNGN